MRTKLGDPHCWCNIGLMADSDILFCYRIVKQNTHLIQVIPADMRIAVTIHYLADGASFSAIKTQLVNKKKYRQAIIFLILWR